MSDKSGINPTPIIGEIVPLHDAEVQTKPAAGQSLSVAEKKPFRYLIPKNPYGNILYVDEDIIRRIYDIVSATAASGIDEQLATQIKSEDETRRYQQVAKLVWNPNRGINFDYLVLLLSWILPEKKSTGELLRSIKDERASGSKLTSIHIGMPLITCGVIKKSRDVQRRGLRLHEDEFSIRTILDKEHTLFRDAEYLRKHFIFCLGIVQNIDKAITIKAGALLL